MLHTHDRAYVLAMASTFVTFVFVELYFGSHVPVVQLITTPSVCLLVFYGYTAWVATSLSEVMYTPLNWRDEPVDALICAARLLILAAFIGGICYCIISARGEYMGTKVYRADPVVIERMRRGIPPPPILASPAPLAAAGDMESGEAALAEEEEEEDA